MEVDFYHHLGRHNIAYILDFCPLGKELYLLFILENVLEMSQDVAVLQALDNVSIDKTSILKSTFSSLWLILINMAGRTFNLSPLRLPVSALRKCTAFSLILAKGLT